MDRIAASKTYQGDAYRDSHPLEYYEKGAGRLGKMIHPDTAGLLHELLKMLAEEGMEGKFDSILNTEGYFPESLFYQFLGYPENLLLADL